MKQESINRIAEAVIQSHKLAILQEDEEALHQRVTAAQDALTAMRESFSDDEKEIERMYHYLGQHNRLVMIEAIVDVLAANGPMPFDALLCAARQAGFISPHPEHGGADTLALFVACMALWEIVLTSDDGRYQVNPNPPTHDLKLVPPP
jgi:hypothetical protein